MKILVTGASGFVGSNIANRLVHDGHDVIALVRPREQSLPLRMRSIDCALDDIPWPKIGKIDAVVHQAAITDTRVRDRERMFAVNVGASLNLFDAAVRHGCGRVVYASSTAVYGNSPAPFVEGRGEEPLNFYGESKLELDRRAMDFARENPDVRIVGLRYCNVFGPGENHKGAMATMIYQLAQQLMRGEEPRLFHDGNQRRDYIYVRDVVSANLHALSNTEKSCVVNCGSGQAVSFNEVVAELQATLGITPRRPITYVDMPPEIARAYQNFTQCDMARARGLIKFEPRWAFRRGLGNYHESGALTAPPIN